MTTFLVMTIGNLTMVFRRGFWLVWWVLGAGLGAGLGVWVCACLRVGVVVWVSGGCVMLGAGCVFGWCWLRSGKFLSRL